MRTARKTWKELEKTAMDREKWKSMISAFRATGHDEDHIFHRSQKMGGKNIDSQITEICLFTCIGDPLYWQTQSRFA